jgi:FixJ family two-component response regulator
MRVLIADDDDAVLMALELLLRHEGMSVTSARSPREVLASMQKEYVDALLLDLNYERDTTSGAEGFSLLDELRQRWPLRPVVVMTGWASIEGAVQAMRRGAVDYVPKPWDNARLPAASRYPRAAAAPGVCSARVERVHDRCAVPGSVGLGQRWPALGRSAGGLWRWGAALRMRGGGLAAC